MMSWVRPLVWVIQHWHLARVLVARTKVGEHRQRVVAGLFGERGIIQRARVDARWRAGLQAIGAQRQFPQALRQPGCGRIAGTPSGMGFEADVDLAGEKSANGQHHVRRTQGQAHLRDHAGDPTRLDHEIVNGLLENLQIGLLLDDAPDRRPCITRGRPGSGSRERLVPWMR